MKSKIQTWLKTSPNLKESALLIILLLIFSVGLTLGLDPYGNANRSEPKGELDEIF